METIFNALTFFGNEFALFVISMIPLIELRGAVILGAALNMNWITVLVVSIIGNMVPVPFLLLFGRKILDWLKSVPLFSKPAHWYEEKLVKKAEKINSYAKWGLFLLVAIPLPGTGAWTGVLAATFLNMKPRQALPMIFLGVLTAGIIMVIGSYGLFGAIRLF
ncbi:MAG TPA: small multidrug export protein [Ruminococcaceae bacterium]|nr:small multi-drug export protein [Oscillospiraceae bacterium]MDD5920074.1 small multi-drug export protein [Oscillospiraceae bacterium]HCB65005.1 small multidrug export protein [Oscillospiraceae bacterium]HCU32803.1 small multidrug export protein [Oscillospiraceae bacterium]